ncbi:siderophore-interacting protein [Spiractinospora alimapuensis]|uniref:siderophore-interacting protein n=1 Tax=Spiractinospora alimapuensis TaxID=2820884 RepID=UPI001F204DCF|nr:siderophore-interacting protein [Spiractinospora alimapuensis]QVQ51246.1 siderophore-interacting protein [Spiractinospora alimapuensis]
MSEPLSATRPVTPTRSSVRTFTVAAVSHPSPGFARVTLRSTGDGFEDEFEHLGYDHWFRLFLPAPDGSLDLPFGPSQGWYSRLLAIEEHRRPVVRNYTIRAARWVGDAWELDVDLVIHRDQTGQVTGVAARWALETQPGDTVGLLDQGRIFNMDDHSGPVLVVADESGLPGVEGIARSRSGEPGDYVLEVPDSADRRHHIDARPVWMVRDHTERVGQRTLDHLRATTIDPAASVYIVGEASFVLGARAIVTAAGVPKDRVQFCSYWRTGRRADRQ